MVDGSVPPHDLDAEAAVLSAVLLAHEKKGTPEHRTAIDRALDIARPEHFYSDANRWIRTAIDALRAEGTPIDILTVASWLRDRERIAYVGGASYLAQVAEATPSVGHVEAHAKIVLEKWRLRALIEAHRCAAALGYGPEAAADVQAYADRSRETIGKLAHVASSELPTIADCLTRALDAGPIAHVATDIAPLDNLTRGGLWPGKLIAVIMGEPDAGKTSLAVQIAHHAARAGYAVLVYAADEDRDGIARRVAQLEGAERDDLESPDASGRVRVETLRDDLAVQLPNLRIVDQDDEGAPDLMTAAATLARMTDAPGCKGAVLVVDSIQKVRVPGTDNARDPRTRADVVVAALKSNGQRWPRMLTIATSEIGRASYGAQPKAADAMRAAKESGGIEYSARHLLLLVKAPDDDDAVDVLVPKNKGGILAGDAATFRLRRDGARCRFTPIDRPADGGKEAKRDREETCAARGAWTHVRIAIATDCPDGISKERLVARMGGNAVRGRSAVNRAAKLGWIVNQGPRTPYVLGAEPPPADPACGKCDGTGDVPQFEHNAGGICFQCHGTGEDPSGAPQCSPPPVRDPSGPVQTACRRPPIPSVPSSPLKGADGWTGGP